MDGPVILNLILGFTEPVVITCSLFCFLHNIKRDIIKGRLVYVAAFLFYITGFTVIMVLNSNNNLLLLFFQLTAGAIISYCLFHKSLLQIFYVVSYTISIFLMQVLVVWLLFAQLLEQRNVLDYPAINTAILVKNVLTIFLTCLWVLFINRQRIVLLSKWGYVSLFIPLAASIFLVFAILQTAELYIQLYGASLIVLALLSVVLLNVYFIYLVSYISKNSRLKHELSLLKAQNEMQFRYYNTLEKKYEHSRKLSHDITNHLHVLEELYKNGDIEKALEYDAELRKTLRTMGQIQYSGCRLLNIILNEKTKEAQEAGITMDIRIGEIGLEQLKDTDITTIFANLLDNAIEAAGKYAPDSYLRIHTDRFHDFIIIHVENSIAPEPKRTIGNKKHEGLGLLNVKNAVESYDGSYHIEESEESFRISINLPL